MTLLNKWLWLGVKITLSAKKKKVQQKKPGNHYWAHPSQVNVAERSEAKTNFVKQKFIYIAATAKLEQRRNSMCIQSRVIQPTTLFSVWNQSEDIYTNIKQNGKSMIKWKII